MSTRIPLLPVWRCLAVLSALGFGCVAPAAEPAWRPLFNGRDLTGWHALPGGKWFVLDGELIGISTATEIRHGLLLTDAPYRDFRLRLKFRAITGNSGVYFRVEEFSGPVGAKGLQAEIEAKELATGGLYETQGRQWVLKADPAVVEKTLQRTGWNVMEIQAVGGDVTVLLNGVVTAAVKNDPGRRQGLIGLQLHGRMEMDVRFKDIEIAEVK
jgi:hypothetical protein